MKNKKICIVGLGYVGLPLAVAFSEKFEVVGFDIDKERIEELNRGYDKTLEVSQEDMELSQRNINFTNSCSDIENLDIYIVTVPTPVDSAFKPDLTPLIEASKLVGSVLSCGDIVIYESTVYPGVTEEVCVPVLESSSNLKFNSDFFCGYSPERINPGDKTNTVKMIKKVTSGSNSEVAQEIDKLYQEVITAGTYLASSIKVAEASKVIENTQRDVNIALINELALIFHQIGIDTNEVIEAAATKWNFLKLHPGLVGGHCIGVDPYYLTYKAEELGYKPNLILASRQINNGMGKYVAQETIKAMNACGKPIKGSSILVFGLTFKEDCPDTRNTKVVDIINEFEDYYINVDVYDPCIDYEKEKLWCKNLSTNPLESEKKYDAVVVAVGHAQFKLYNSDTYSKLTTGEQVVIDVKNIYDNATWKL